MGLRDYFEMIRVLTAHPPAGLIRTRAMKTLGANGFAGLVRPAISSAILSCMEGKRRTEVIHLRESGQRRSQQTSGISNLGS